jgi:hypothetical protein
VVDRHSNEVGTRGALAHLGERNAGSVEVKGSNPLSSIRLRFVFCFCEREISCPQRKIT